MEENKPRVIPTAEQIAAANSASNAVTPGAVSDTERLAAEAMARRTAEQKAAREALLAQQAIEAAMAEVNKPIEVLSPGVSSAPSLHGETVTPGNTKIGNTAFDIIPLPSEGKIYPSRKASIKVAYLTASDENVLTSPNLIDSGEFMDILFNNKILDEHITYKDLHTGDRNAIMIWLRATGYGPMYPVIMIDPETGEEFEHEIDLSKLPIKKLGATPDKDGLFDFRMPVSGKLIKFKLLTVGDLERIEEVLKYEKETLGVKVNNSVTYNLEKSIIEVDGNRDLAFIRDFAQNLRVGDSRGLRKYIDEIESGVDLSLKIRTPGGGSIDTFLPLTRKFFWPDF